MAYNITITEVTPVITLTETPSGVFTVTNENNVITVNQPATVTFDLSQPTYTFTATTNASLIRGENLATSFKGEFEAGTHYVRGDTVRYNGAVYVANVDPDVTITSSTTPPANAQWKLIFSQIGNLSSEQVAALVRTAHFDPWKASTSYQLYDWTWSTSTRKTYVLTSATGALNYNPDSYPQYWTNVGGASSGDSVTYANLTITNQLTVAGVKYPTINGNLGQVLTTNGENQATWQDISSLSLTTATTSNLGVIRVGLGLQIDPDGTLNVTSATNILRYWNLSSDMTTNGFDIYTGEPTNPSSLTPIPQLTIGSGKLNTMKAGLVFDSRTTSTEATASLVANKILNVGIGTPTTGATGNHITFTTSSVAVSGAFVQNTGTAVFGITPTFSNGIVVNGTVVQANAGIRSTSMTATVITATGSASVGGPFTANSVTANTGTFNQFTATSIAVGVPGIRFPDGTIMTSTHALLSGGAGGGSSGTGTFYAGLGLTATQTVTATTFSLLAATSSTRGGVKIGENISYDNNIIDVEIATRTVAGIVKVGDGIAVGEDGTISISTTTSTTKVFAGVGTNVYNSGTGVVVNLNTATTSDIGGIVVGDGLTIDAETAVLDIAPATTSTIGGFKTGSSVYMSGANLDTLNINTATTNAIGGVKVGSTLNINQYTAVLNANTATSTTTGIIQVGSTFDITGAGVLTVKTATDSVLGVASFGDGLNVSAGDVTLKAATTSTLGGVKVGYNLSIDPETGELSALSARSSFGFDLNQDATTNGYSIRYNTTTNTSTYLTLGDGSAYLNADSATRLELANGSAKLYSNSNNKLELGNSAVALNANSTVGLTLDTSKAKLQFDSDSWLQINATTLKLQNTTATYLAFNAGVVDLRANSVNALQIGNSNVDLFATAATKLSMVNEIVDLSANATARLHIQNNNVGLYGNTNTNLISLSSGTVSILADTTASLHIEQGNTSLYNTATNYLTMTSALTTLKNNHEIKIDAPLTQFGTLYDSSVYVGSIWNQAGTGAPLFPEGTQYADLTVQKTAWQGYDQGTW